MIYHMIYHMMFCIHILVGLDSINSVYSVLTVESMYWSIWQTYYKPQLGPTWILSLFFHSLFVWLLIQIIFFLSVFNGYPSGHNVWCCSHLTTKNIEKKKSSQTNKKTWCSKSKHFFSHDDKDVQFYSWFWPVFNQILLNSIMWESWVKI